MAPLRRGLRGLGRAHGPARSITATSARVALAWGSKRLFSRPLRMPLLWAQSTAWAAQEAMLPSSAKGEPAWASGLPASRQRMTAICSRVTGSLGPNRSSE